MKQKLFLFFLVLAGLMAFSACERSAFPETVDSITASVETMTRTQLSPDGEMYQVLWCEGDRIALTDGSRTSIYKADAGGATTATFSPEAGSSALPAGRYTAWYPASLADGFLPAIQQYGPDGWAESPMCAESETNEFIFRNLCGFIRLDVATSLNDIVLDRIVVTADQPLSGAFTRNGDAAVVTSGEGVRLDCGGVALASEAKSFYISVPENTYTGLSFLLYTTDNRCQKVELQKGATYRVERSTVCEISLVAGDFEETPRHYAILRPGPDFNHELKKLSGTRRTVADSDSVVKMVIFETGSHVGKGTRIDDYDSPIPIWMNYDKATGTATVSTLADEIRTGRNAAYIFSKLMALEEVVNMRCLNTSAATMMNNMFHHAGKRGTRPLKLDFSSFDTRNVRSFYQMFQYCVSVESLDLSSFETPELVNLDNMFAQCHALKDLDISHFNTEKVTTFRSLFNRCESLKELDLDHFDTRNGTLMTYMFYSMKSLERISLRGFDINRSSANIGYFFQMAPNLKEIFVGDGFRKEASYSLPTSFFTVAAETDGVRTASLSKELTIHCTAASAEWLARTNLRWVHSGYRSATPITVKFIDNTSGEELFPTWAAN